MLAVHSTKYKTDRYKANRYLVELSLPKLNKEIPINVTLKKIKRLNIRIKGDGVDVSAPLSYSKQTVKLVLNQHIDWISNKLIQHKERLKLLPTLSANEIFYLGKIQTIDKMISGMDKYEVNEFLKILTDENEIYKDRLIKWYKMRASKLLTARAEELSKAFFLPYNKVSTREAKHRWGSCNSKKNISLNCKLILAPEYVIDAIILHELTHTVHLNHSEIFWSELHNICPHWTNASNWLTQYNPLIQKIFKKT